MTLQSETLCSMRQSRPNFSTIFLLGSTAAVPRSTIKAAYPATTYYVIKVQACALVTGIYARVAR